MLFDDGYVIDESEMSRIFRVAQGKQTATPRTRDIT